MGIIEAVPGILAFGSFGLAFLMAYLGYRLLRAEVAVTGRPPSGPILGVISFFLLVAIALMIVAGFFEIHQKSVKLVVHFPYSIPKDIDPPKIKVGSKTQPLDENRDVLITVKDEQQVLVMLESLVNAIQELRQKAVSQAKKGSNPDDIGIGDED